METHVFHSPTANLSVLPITYDQAVDRVIAGKPTFWLEQWSVAGASGLVADYQEIGTNTGVRTTKDGQSSNFPLDVDGRMTNPQDGEEGWWFGKPAPFAMQLPRTVRWWAELGRYDASLSWRLTSGLGLYRELLAGGDLEHDWVNDPEALMEYALAWVSGRASQVFEGSTPHLRAEGLRPIGITNLVEVRSMISTILNKGLDAQVYGVRGFQIFET